MTYPNRSQNMTVGRRRYWKNQGFLKQRKPKMVRTEQLKYIQLLHERVLADSIRYPRADIS